MSELLTWEDIADTEAAEEDFILDPYVVREGITFLWGRWGRGKSPVTWYMAHSIATGADFFGLPTKRARVLYLDVDSPPPSAKKRIKKIPLSKTSNVHFLLSKPLSLPSTPEQDEDLKRVVEKVKPEVVFLNTLRKIHDLEDRESKSVKQVYSYYQKIFHKAALVFVHHEKKESPDPRVKRVEQESFSGSQAWINDAQVGLHLQRYEVHSSTTKRLVQNLKLIHHKSQVSELIHDMPLLLHSDGVTLTSRRKDSLETLIQLKKEFSGVSLDRHAATVLDCSESWARKLRYDLEQGRYPGSRMFLSSPDGDAMSSSVEKDSPQTTGGKRKRLPR